MPDSKLPRGQLIPRVDVLLTLPNQIWLLHGHKSAADFLSGVATEASVDCELAGVLQLSKSGWLVLTAPAAIAAGAASALTESGATPIADVGRFAHVPVCSPAELKAFRTIPERGRSFRYTLGRLEVVRGLASGSISRFWFFRVLSADLQNLRKSYGLPPFPYPGFFVLPVALRRRGVLQSNRISKVFDELDLLSTKTSAKTHNFHGLKLVVETPRGECRDGWDTPVKHDYGYVDGQRPGGDGEDLDCWVDPDGLDVDLVHVANQNRKDGSFDEHKLLFGFRNEKEARKGYLANYPKGFESRLRSSPAFTVPQIEKWLTDANLSKPAEAPL